MNETTAQEIRSLVIPADPLELLVPSSMIAEIMRPNRLAAAADPLFGRLEWRGLNVPVMSIEMLLESRRPRIGPRSQVVVLYPRSADTADQFLGLISSAEPHSRGVERDQLQAVPGSASSFVQAYVRLGEDALLIPDMEAIFDLAFRQ